MKKEIVVIGAGIAGLTSAVWLSKQGAQVKLFEANSKVGGACATTSIEGYTFNDGAMYLVPFGLFDGIFEQLGLNRSKVLPLRRITNNTTAELENGARVSLSDRRDISIETDGISQGSERLQRDIEALLEKWGPFFDVFIHEILPYPFSFKRLLAKSWRYLPRLRGTIGSELNSLISDPSLRSALASVLLYTGMPVDKLPVLSFAGILALLRDGFYLPEGGMGKIPEVLSQAGQSNGVELSLNSKINQIIIRNGAVQGVMIAGGEFVKADAVIATTNAMTTYSALVDSQSVPRKIAHKVHTAPLSHSAISLQLGLSNQIAVPSHSVNIIPMLADHHKIFEPFNGKLDWFSYSVPTMTMPELAPSGGSLIEMYIPVDREIFIKTLDSSQTQSLVDMAIQALSARHDLKIAVQRVRAPLDFRDQMHMYQGALYGLSPAADISAFFPHKSPISGLYQAGQTTYPGYSVISAALSGIFAAKELLK